MAKFCTNCGHEVLEEDNVCSNCGTPLKKDFNVSQQETTVVKQVQPKKTNGVAIAGFVTSLISLLLCCGGGSLISLILSIVGMTKTKDCNGDGKGFSIAGIIISVVGILLFLLIIVLAYVLDTNY